MATATLTPDGDTTTQWGKTQPEAPSTHYDKLDEGTTTPNDGDWVESDTLGEIEQYTLTASPGDLSTTTAVAVNWRGAIDDLSRMRTIQLDLFHSGSTPVAGNPQIVTVEDLGGPSIVKTVTKTWSGLSLTKSQTDSLECRKTHASKL